MYFFIWSLIRGDIVVVPPSVPATSWCDSRDPTDQLLPKSGRAPIRGGIVVADRPEDSILDDGIFEVGRGGRPALSTRMRWEAAPEATLKEEQYSDIEAPVTDEKSSASPIIDVERDSDCVGSDDSDSFLRSELVRSCALSKKHEPKNASVSETVSGVDFVASLSGRSTQCAFTSRAPEDRSAWRTRSPQSPQETCAPNAPPSPSCTLTHRSSSPLMSWKLLAGVGIWGYPMFPGEPTTCRRGGPRSTKVVDEH